MKTLFIVFLTVFLTLCGASGKSELQAAEKYPVKPITFIVPVDAGGGLDVAIRPFCEKLGAILGQPVVVVNKPGAGSTIAYRAVHDAKPDGYTIGTGGLTLVTNKLQGLSPFDYHDYTILGAHQKQVPIIVAATKGKRTFKTFKEVIEFAKAHPKGVSVAAGGRGQSWWNACMEFQSVTEIRFNVVLQEAAGAASIAQAAGGHVDLAFVSLAEGRPQIDGGNVRLLAIFGDRRPPSYPDVPTLDELGYHCRLSSVSFNMGPPNMPKEITELLVKANEVATNDPNYKKFLEERVNSIPLYWSPEQTINELDKQRETVRDILDKAGILKEK